jgi:hypothetical protein
MDQQQTQPQNNFVNEFLSQKVSEILSSPAYIHLNEDQKMEKRTQIEDQLMGVVLDTVVDNLPDDAVIALQDLDPNSEEMEQKLMEHSSQIPNLVDLLEGKLNSEIESLKNPSFTG